MNPTDFICGLMRQNTNALGFIPTPTIKLRFVQPDRYVIQRNRLAKAIGYILHGPVRPDRTLRIHQACIELDRRNRGFGAQAVSTVVDRANRGQALRITLRCATDLDAVHFWITCGFLPTHLSEGGLRRRRTIIHFNLDLTTTSTPEGGSRVIVTPTPPRPRGRSEFQQRGLGQEVASNSGQRPHFR